MSRYVLFFLLQRLYLPLLRVQRYNLFIYLQNFYTLFFEKVLYVLVSG